MKTCIIIGGGLGGLVSGALLAKEGYKVTVLEKNAIIGGGLQTFKRHGVSFPTGMHIFGGFSEGGNLKKIFDYLGVTEQIALQPTDDDAFDVVTVGEDGKISDVTITSATDNDFAKELVRVIKHSPKWKPATKDGKPVPYGA